MTIVKFTIPGVPIPQSRPRFTRQGHAYESAKSKGYKRLVATAAKAAMGAQEPLQGALWLAVTFYMPIPKSLSKKKREELAGVYVVKRPDTDNLVKSVADGMIGIVYGDDAQIALITAQKIYGEEPKVDIRVSEL